MPREAIALGGAVQVLPLSAVPAAILSARHPHNVMEPAIPAASVVPR
jgi:chemotaxis response regulator CheB